MEKKVKIMCAISGFFGILAAGLSFAAEATRIKASDVNLSSLGACEYPRSPAFALGSIAGLALVIAQVVINAAAGCICCKKYPLPQRSKWAMTLVCFTVSWITFVIAFLLLLSGAALNDEHTGEERTYFYTYCYVVKPGVFAGAAILCLASTSLGIIYFIFVSSAKTMESWNGHLNHGIAMAQPQFPPQNTQPVFVHEDTYNRQQIP